MSLATKVGDVVENADIDRDSVQPQIHIEERRLSLLDFLKTAIKINGSDVHLQAGSVPMIRVDGRARYLDCPELTAATLMLNAALVVPVSPADDAVSV